jgi:hypothetical protein
MLYLFVLVVVAAALLLLLIAFSELDGALW